jgi:glyoxylase-like metal-dependent hydrolase (beta-lactamase superfamily II)
MHVRNQSISDDSGFQTASFILSIQSICHLVLSLMPDLIDGVTRIAVPTPFPVGSINCYLIEGSPLTLIDTGPKTSKSLDTIEKELQGLSYNLSDIEQILLTHGHVDHIGLVAHFVRERTRVHGNAPKVWINRNDAQVLTDYDRYMELYMRSIVKLVAECGVPRNQGQLLAQENRTRLFNSIGESVPTARSFEDGTTFKTGIGEIVGIWVPGHSLGSTCFVCDEQEIMFSGDHILGDISSNPSISFDGSERISMLTYFESLDRLSSRERYTAYPGHREPILDIKKRIEILRAEYDDKLQKAADSLMCSSQTIYEISRTVYGNYEMSSLILALAESYDLVRILEKRNQARIIRQNGLIQVVQP